MRGGYGTLHDGGRYEVHLCEQCLFRTLANLKEHIERNTCSATIRRNTAAILASLPRTIFLRILAADNVAGAVISGLPIGVFESSLRGVYERASEGQN
ncbi:MAG: hypothetical protein EOP02_34620 [Proteobacteria bacterium]|nr:MAG: hypothetical protein EOP02_34620 [Pseudomonadota bacterium]